jgi:UDP-glucose 4-epimerase
MKILITGSRGFVGTHLVKRLQKKHEIVSYDLKDGEDVADKIKLSKKMKGCDVAIHLAALVSVSESWEKPYDYLHNNGIGTFNLINEAINAGVKRVIYFSSAAVYGNPLTPYAASKLWGENICEVYKNTTEILTLRPFNIYGPGQNLSYGYVIHNFIEGIKKEGKITIYGNGYQTRDFISIDDVCDVVEKMLTQKIPNEPVDLGTGIETKIIDLAGMVGKILNKDFEVKYLKKRNEPYDSVADTNKLSLLGFEVSNFKKLEIGLKNLISNEN